MIKSGRHISILIVSEIDGFTGKRASVSSSVSSAPSETSLNTPRHGQTMDHTAIKASEDMDVDEDEAVMTVTLKDVVHAA